MPRARWIRILVPAAVLALCCGGFFACGQWGPSGKVVTDFLAAVERGDLAAADAFAYPETDRPAPSGAVPPTTPWHPGEILDVAMNDSPRSYVVTVVVTAEGQAPAEFAFGVERYDEIVYAVQRATVTVKGGPADVDFAGVLHPATRGFEVWVLPGVYEVRVEGVVSTLLVSGGVDAGEPTLTVGTP